MPYDKNGKFYTTRIEDDLKGDDPLGRLVERSVSARKGAKAGVALGSRLGPVGGALGGTLGGISGFILGDREIVFPVDMIAIPAFQAYLIDKSRGGPEFMIYIKEGEVLNQVIPTDAMEAEETLSEPLKPSKTRKKSKYHAAYGKHFKALAPKFKLKSGAWAKDGFKRCQKAAHAATKKGLKK